MAIPFRPSPANMLMAPQGLTTPPLHFPGITEPPVIQQPWQFPQGQIPDFAHDPGLLQPAMHFGNQAPAGPSISPIDFDTVVRTVWGEAAREGPVGQQAVAAVILNRARQAGMSPGEVALAKNQFEPWWNDETRPKLEGLSPDSREYQEIAANILPVFESGVDPTGGADHFYSPKAQRALGRKPPSWDNGTGADIGNHRFFSLGYGGQGRTQLAGRTPLPRERPSAPIPRARPQDTAPDALMAFAPQQGQAPGIQFPMDVFAEGEAEGAPIQLAAMEGPAMPRARPQPAPQQRRPIETPKVSGAGEPVVPPNRADLEAVERELMRRGLLEDVSATEPSDRRVMGLAERGGPPDVSDVALPGAQAAAHALVEGAPVIGPLWNQAMEGAEAVGRSFASGRPFEEELAQVQDRVQRLQEAYPGVDWWGQLAGSVGGLAPAVAAAPRLFGAAANQGRFSRAAFGAGSGAAIAGADTLARGGDAEEAVSHALTGAGLGAVAPFVAKPFGRLVARLRGNRTPLRTEGAATRAIRETAGEEFNNPKVKELVLKKTSFDDLLDDLEGLAKVEGGEPIPSISSALGKFRKTDKAGQPVTWDELQELRSKFGDVFRSNDDRARGVAADLTERLDDFLTNSTPDMWARGNYEEAFPHLAMGRALWRTMNKSRILDDAVNRAYDNPNDRIGPSLRNEFNRLLNTPQLRRMFNQDEIDLIRTTARRGNDPSQWNPELALDSIETLRSMALGGGIGLGLGALTTGTLMGGAVGAGALSGVAGGAAIFGARAVTDKLVSKQAREAAAMVRPPDIIRRTMQGVADNLGLPSGAVRDVPVQPFAPPSVKPIDPRAIAIGEALLLGQGVGQRNRLEDPVGLNQLMVP